MASSLTGRLVTGGLIVLVGLALLLSTTGVAEPTTLWDWVPLVFVLLGLWALLRSGFRNLTGPVMIVAIAGVFLLRNLGFVSAALVATWWPLLIVLFGVLFMINRSRQRRRLRSAGLESDGEFTAIGIFGGGDRRPSGGAFTGGEVLALFGGVDLDLRDVTVPNPPAVVEIICLFGGSEIRVPEGWDVRLDVLALFGGASDSRPRRSSSGEPTEGRPGDEPDLVVTGVVLFGGVDVRD